jgi:hypothetical protein
MDRTLDRLTTALPGPSPPQFETGDFYLACFLRCIGYDLLDMRREGRRAFFVFEDRPSRQADLLAFFGNKTEVKPLRFVSAIKDLKALLHAA